MVGKAQGSALLYWMAALVCFCEDLMVSFYRNEAWGHEASAYDLR